MRGSIRKVGDSVRVHVRLHQSPDTIPILEKDYQGGLGDLPRLQQEITVAISGALRARIEGTERSRLAARPAVDQRAYDAYLRGRFHLERGESEQALQMFQQATRIAPGWAAQGRYDDATAALRNAERLATALAAEDVLALTYMNQAAVAQLRRRYDQAIALAERAVALQDHIGQPHRLAESLATLGQVYVKLGRLEPADEALQRALATAPATRGPEITGAATTRSPKSP